eukprot:scaffold95929_cov28-Tisochrysis_lutea.AAC.2
MTVAETLALDAQGLATKWQRLLELTQIREQLHRVWMVVAQGCTAAVKLLRGRFEKSPSARLL